MKTRMTLGDLIATLHDGFEKELGDGEAASVATQLTVTALLGRDRNARSIARAIRRAC